MSREYILVINPGSTSTKVGIFKGKENVIQKTLVHSSQELEKYEKLIDQYEFRKNMIIKWMEEEGYSTSQLIAVVGRGGLLRPMPGGTYKVTDKMIEDLRIGVQGEHASNLGGIIAKAIADMENIESYIVDPVAVDEFEDIARISGIPQITRRSLGHALNIKAVGRKVANSLGYKFEDMNMIVAHLGGGISIAPVKKGKNVDYNNANEMGPFSPERTGGLPVGDLAKMCFSGKYTFNEIKTKLRGKGGLVAYLGTNDAREVMKRIENGDEKAKLVFDAMAYQIGKEIGAMATVLNGDVKAIVITGGLAYSKYLTDYITDMVSFIAPVIVEPGEDELKALNEGALRVINNEETPKIYEQEVKF
ncbi:butyrate kinase [Alkalithermobacter thermoalcaliphilus JW-YL-7 = DSM 7308]|uniref:Probable butyrate kinase n=1 Tax=Alkalithermobacter thermoalcaliphilus JW-YL-7 = DSM 7308 TaxID=1121328 RepID=A0A150FN34_CLOPD|nr:butyrate kinase [[Clostridium] paradoxum JW-YL-7 = DSM 7308]SHL36030.1 butyrate kinase [[Clostridium] paradoxum JW-YL-7 = DSM 7308]